jgi:hypothetical protein
VPGFGQARRYETVVGDDQQRRVLEQVGGCGSGEALHESPLGSYGQGWEHVHEPLAGSRQDRVAQHETPDVLVQSVEVSDRFYTDLFHVIRDAQLETSGIVVF